MDGVPYPAWEAGDPREAKVSALQMLTLLGEMDTVTMSTGAKEGATASILEEEGHTT